MNYIKEIFSGKEERLSAKRVIGTGVIIIALTLWIDSHFTIRELNMSAFNTALTIGGAMIGVGVAEGLLDKFKKKPDASLVE